MRKIAAVDSSPSGSP